MAFEALAEAAERWCARTPFQLIAAEETERRMDFYAEPGVSFYVLCPEAACGDNFHVWSESEDCLPFLQLAQDYISSCGKKTLHEILEKVFKSFRPCPQLSETSCRLQSSTSSFSLGCITKIMFLSFSFDLVLRDLHQHDKTGFII
ncbi:maturin isoform X1 [Falco biarmicus]|uniref:maturin isoform X1 n=1 Tax=Falco rusticolus TaxID=120794 RepID=UPI0018868FF5|nr:maturin isoform X1 [Falco rusticolus]XP_040447669.1 maturin isoform X1 [Falco naumanni]XP_055563886.1 maturin isoform X1 [Falco cherrug]XP_055659907.1 maturin isoform X1 [Falco peregrinus]XP_056191422.1 maturin isoform X1 [Falco biarmicus]